MEKVPVYIYLKIKNAAEDEHGNPAPAYGSLLVGYAERDSIPAYEDLTAKASISQLMELIPLLKGSFKEEDISYCTPEEYFRETCEGPAQSA